MCHEPDATPPVPAGPSSVTSARLVLEARDGNRLAALRASPSPSPSASAAAEVGVLVLPDVRGLHGFYEQLAVRFAEHGIEALAIDYFGRTAGVEPRADDFDHMEHVQRTTFEGLQADIDAAVADLRARGCRSVFTVGFCFGGRLSWLAAAEGHGITGAVGFYGRPGPFQDGRPGPIQRAGEIEAPILALMGGADAGIPVEEAQQLDRALAAAGVEHEVVIYPGAPHSFFDRAQDAHAEASADAWRRVLDFVERHAAG
jgi:carboxymethylenebutenolidase